MTRRGHPTGRQRGAQRRAPGGLTIGSREASDGWGGDGKGLTRGALHAGSRFRLSAAPPSSAPPEEGMDQSYEGRGYIPTERTNQMRGEGIVSSHSCHLVVRKRSPARGDLSVKSGRA
eukprot:1189563-Prorocentrum_minimum.AAC.5